MYTLLIVLFVFVCIVMIITILLQASKGGGLAGTFGGMGGSGGFLGARGAVSLLQKLTVGLAISYGVLCLIISLLSRPVETQPSDTQERIRQEQQVNPTPAPLPDNPENVPEQDSDN